MSSYTAKEAAAKLGIGESTLRRWADEGLVGASDKSGGYKPRRRYTMRDLIRAKIVHALVKSPHGLRGKRLRSKVEDVMRALPAGDL